MKSRKVKSAARSKAYIKKLKSTIPLEVEDNSFDENEISENDDEEFEHKKDSASEEEVLPITDDETSEDDDENKEESSEAEDDLPNLDNWGKRKSTYFNADFVDKDRGKTYRDEDLELENAEREAVYLQQQTAAGLDKYESTAYYEDYDRAIELISKRQSDEPLDVEMEDIDNTKAEKLKHEKRKYPKFLEYKTKFMEKFTEVNSLAALIQIAGDSTVDDNFIYYMKLKYQILLHYLLNISFYLYLKSSETVPDNHPIYQRIEQFKELDDKMNSHNNYLKEISASLERLNQNKEVFPKASKTEVNFAPSKLKSKKEVMNDFDVKASKKERKAFKQLETEEEKKIFALYNKMKGQQNKMEFDESKQMEDLQNNNPVEEDNTGEKRTITYQIAKNKGLVPRRKKEYRNPRVHHRLKFRKAKIRRKGQVKGVVKEIKRYAGEPTGISAHVVRSIKLK